MKLTRNLSSKFTSRAVEEYLYGLLPKRDAVLAEMERYAARHSVPIVGPAVARLLALMVEVRSARRIFEMGSAIGYSTIWLARAAGRSAEVFYTDGDPANAERAAKYFRRAGVRDRIRILTGDSIELLKRTAGRFDLIFNDVDKEQYPDVLRAAVPRLNRGGLLIADNTLWSGKVTRSVRDAETRGIQRFNELTFSSRDLHTVIVPLRDGVTLARKR